jgi:hypothetical protein
MNGTLLRFTEAATSPGDESGDRASDVRRLGGAICHACDHQRVQQNEDNDDDQQQQAGFAGKGSAR